MNFLARVGLSALTIWLLSVVSHNVVLGTGGGMAEVIITALLVGLILTVVNAIIRPVLKLMSLPFYFLTFGLYSLVVNTLMLWLVSWITTELFTLPFGGLHIGDGSFWSYFWAALLLAFIQTVVSWFTPGIRRANGTLKADRRANQYLNQP